MSSFKPAGLSVQFRSLKSCKILPSGWNTASRHPKRTMKPFSHQRYNYFYLCLRLNQSCLSDPSDKPSSSCSVVFSCRLVSFCPKWHAASSVSGISLRSFLQLEENKLHAVRHFYEFFFFLGWKYHHIWLRWERIQDFFCLTLCSFFRNVPGFIYCFSWFHHCGLCLTETSGPSLHVVALRERVPGAGAHRRGRVWGSL